MLEQYEIAFKENFSLVRGLDYYCHTVFEFKSDSLGSQDTIIGGGRYDGLIETLGGQNIPGVGWAGGVERIMMLMQDKTNKNEAERRCGGISNSAATDFAAEKLYDSCMKKAGY